MSVRASHESHRRRTLEQDIGDVASLSREQSRVFPAGDLSADKLRDGDRFSHDVPGDSFLRGGKGQAEDGGESRRDVPHVDVAEIEPTWNPFSHEKERCVHLLHLGEIPVRAPGDDLVRSVGPGQIRPVWKPRASPTMKAASG